MLVLKRKVEESIVIGGNSVVKVCGLGDGFVRLGVEAPKDVTVDRQEVHQRKVAEVSTHQLSTTEATDGL